MMTRVFFVNSAIIVFLLFQIAVPLTNYYLAGEEADERFTWRMFSSYRMQQCQVTVTETTSTNQSTVVSLEKLVQPAWVRVFQQFHQPEVIDEFLQWQCTQHPTALQVAFERTCRATDGQPLPPFHRSHPCL